MTREEKIALMYSINKKSRIQTHSGTISTISPSSKDVHIRDIAHGLSYHACRWFQAGDGFYSVAQHSVEACIMAPEKHKLAALMHDASKAYIHDGYMEIEKNLMRVIATKYGFTYPLDEVVKIINRQLLEKEWCDYVIDKVVPEYKPDYWKTTFLKYFKELTYGKKFY